MKAITEADGHQAKWMAAAKAMTVDGLPDFIRHLTQDYLHDYGTICHAIAAAAVAAANAVEKTPQGGITGFQAGEIFWEFAKGWGSPSIGECGSRLVNMDDLLFPQYERLFTSISSDTWERLKEKAAKNLEESKGLAHPAVVAHWKSVANGNVPFGLKVAS